MTKLPGFVNAVKRPFQDLKSLVIGIIIMFIPIVNFIAYGYFLECAKTALRRNYKLPPWTNWGGLFVKGLVAMIIGFIYMIPVAIIATVAIAGTVLAALSSTAMTGAFTSEALVGSLAAAGIGLVVTAIVGIIFALLAIAAVIRYAETGKFGAAFQFSAIMKKAFTGTFFGMWILALIYGFIVSAVIGFIFNFIPYIGSYLGMTISAYIVGVTVYTILAEAYARR